MYIGKMARKYAPNRIREIRKGLRMSMEALAGSLPGSPAMTTIAKLERGQMGLTLDYMVDIAKVLGCQPSDLIDSSPDVTRRVPMLGRVPAGPWREAITDKTGSVPLPEGVGGPNCFALRPDGDSMNLLIPEVSGAFIVVDPDQTELLNHKVYVIANGEKETTFKRFGINPARFEPVSSNPKHEPIIIGQKPFSVVGRVVYAGMEL